MATGVATGVRVKREKNRLYFVDKSGQVRSVKRRTGGKAGRKSCWPRKSPTTGRKIAHPRFGTEGRRSHKHTGRKSGRKGRR